MTPKGFAWLREHGSEEGKFICVIPRLRYTPYYKVNNVPRVPADDVRDAINNRTTEKDHAKAARHDRRLCEETGNKVMACAEMTYQVELAKQVLVDPLPADVKKNVVWRDTYWLPDEAASIYSKAQAVVSVECHSPLIALHNGTPAIYVRQPTDTCKGQMYRDFGRGRLVLRSRRNQRRAALVAPRCDSSQSREGQIAGSFHYANSQSAAKAHGGRRQADLPRLIAQHSTIRITTIVVAGSTAFHYT